MERFVCTGGTGSIGSYFPATVTRLRQRLCTKELLEEVRNFSDQDPKAARSFFHLAAMVRPEDCDRDPHLAHQLNVKAAADLYNQCTELGFKKFIFVSTSHVFTPTPGLHFLTPDDPVAPRSTYGRTKVQAEEELLRLSSQSATELVVARVFSVLSLVDRPGFILQNLIKKAVSTSEIESIPGLGNFRDFLWAEDVVADLMKLASPEPMPPIVHLGSGQPTQIVDLVRSVFSRFAEKEWERRVDLPKIVKAGNFLVSVPFFKRPAYDWRKPFENPNISLHSSAFQAS